MNRDWLNRLLLSFIPGELKCCLYCGKQLSEDTSKKGKSWCCSDHAEKLRVRRHSQSVEFQKSQRKYRLTDKRKKTHLRYWRSEKGKFIKLKYHWKRKTNISLVRHLFSWDEWKNLLEQTKGICPSCKKDVGITNLTLDHIIPLSQAKKGQIYRIADVQPLCRSCNSKKGKNSVNYMLEGVVVVENN